MDLHPILLAPEEAVGIVSQFFPEEWASVSPQEIIIDRIKMGTNNAVYIVSTNKVIKKEPLKMVIRKYGEVHYPTYKAVLGSNTLAEDLAVCVQLASQGLGPKIYGIFEGGRIEEYIDSRIATGEDILDDKNQSGQLGDFESDLAKNFARFHAARGIPLPKPGYLYIDKLKEAKNSMSKVIEEILTISELKGIHGVTLHNWDYELSVLGSLLNLAQHRIVFMLWGAHCANIGVRNNRQPGQLRSFLFDYEMSCFNLRGKDIGHYLANRNGHNPHNPPFDDWKMGDKVLPPMDIIKAFITLYSNECQSLFEDWDPEGLDSPDHILQECLIGGMASALEWLFSHITNFRTGMEKFGVEGLSRKICRLNQLYLECKEFLNLETGYLV